MEEGRGRVELISQEKLGEVRNAEEDWTGKADPKERRRLQNRLHQRAWREWQDLRLTYRQLDSEWRIGRRKAEQAAASSSHPASTHRSLNTDTGTSIQTYHDPLSSAFARASTAIALPSESNTSKTLSTASSQTVIAHGPQPSLPSSLHHLMTLNLRSSPTPINASVPSSQASTFSPKYRVVPSVLAYLEPSVARSSAARSNFPLSPDHYLITLIQYNVYRAIISNLSVCSLLDTLPQNCSASLYIPAIPFPEYSALPPSFEPTPFQACTPHKPWMDSIPDPQFRENMIKADLEGLFDEDELCDDMIGGLFDGYNDCETRGLLVWGEPWMTSSWELSDGFAAKWGWLLKGCREMVNATNRWREGRGEERLVVEIE